ncbi:MAG: hypothetical protein WC450_03770 [Candidatus Omnitrophota bacterium]
MSMKIVSLGKIHHQERNLEAFLFSILIHVFIFTSVSFLFDNLTRTPKPTFVFLGPILGYEEVQNLKKQGSPADPGPALSNGINVQIQTSRPSVYSVHNTQADKTLFMADIQDGTKTYLKNHFIEGKSRVQIERDELLKLGIDPGIPRRVPLRLSF